jgi:cytochrome c-type biogenesis protein CcmH/NrfG
VNRTCHECGAINTADAEICAVCGEPLAAASEHEARVAQATGTTTSQPPSSSNLRTYIIAALAVVGITAAIYFLTGSDGGKTLPPAAPAATGENSALPPNHPAMDAGPTPEQKKMIEDLKAQLAQNPNNVELKKKLADVLYDANQHAEAVGYYRDYVKLHPDSANARTDMAYSMYQTGDLEGAIAELKDVVALAGKHQNAAYNLAMMYVVKRQLDSVKYWMDRVIAIDSTTVQAQNARQVMDALKEAHPGAAPADSNRTSGTDSTKSR